MGEASAGNTATTASAQEGTILAEALVGYILQHSELNVGPCSTACHRRATGRDEAGNERRAAAAVTCPRKINQNLSPKAYLLSSRRLFPQTLMPHSSRGVCGVATVWCQLPLTPPPSPKSRYLHPMARRWHTGIPDGCAGPFGGDRGGGRLGARQFRTLPSWIMSRPRIFLRAAGEQDSVGSSR